MVSSDPRRARESNPSGCKTIRKFGDRRDVPHFSGPIMGTVPSGPGFPVPGFPPVSRSLSTASSEIRVAVKSQKQSQRQRTGVSAPHEQRQHQRQEPAPFMFQAMFEAYQDKQELILWGGSFLI